VAEGAGGAGMSKAYTILAISDIHMSNKLPYALPTTNGLTDRLEDQIKLWEHVKATCVAHPEVKAVYVLGDLFDKALVDPVTLTVTVACIVALPVPVYILPGNHDSNSVRGGRFIVEAFGAMDKPHVHSLVTGVPVRPTSWLTLWPMAFAPVEPSMEALAAIRAKMGDGLNVLLAHHSIMGCKHMNWTCDDGMDPGELCEGFHAVFTGHFHDHQRFGPELQGMYLGAPMHHKYDDAGRGAQYWLVKFIEDAPAPRVKPIDPGLPRFHLIDAPDGAVPEDAKPGDFVRWRVRATADDWARLAGPLMELVAAANAAGFRADYRYKPIPTTAVRLAGSEVAEPGMELDGLKPAPLEDQIAAYVGHVAPSGADAEMLVRLGREILGEARHAG
jgi:hypothetical protein